MSFFDIQKQQKAALDLKLQRIRELSQLIGLHKKQTLTTQQSMEVHNLEVKLEYRLNDLIMRSKHEEADIKITVYEDVLKIINRKHD